MSELILSLAQFGATRNVELNRSTALELIARAGADADLVVLPENAMYSDPTRERPEENYSETLDGPFVTALREAAQQAEADVVSGFTETSDDERSFNTLVHIDAQGELAGVYRKVHLYDAFGHRESDTVRPADITSPLVFELKGLRIGAATCYDLRFPEMGRWLVDHGADVIVLPAAWAVGPMKELHWEMLARARAIENTVYFAACGQTGPSCTGQSMIVDPMGVIVASAGESAGGIATARIRKERLETVRKANPSLANRRFTVAPSA
ncbi:carbon-nitrogen hydrolase family protein [Leucobacter sp. wl10]|uniref:carbon-nitrogen hydrolase family protein n=1 Tax=Leucobacter sp. wl10 TaxID=2304677 RepID=UPI000E5C492E|nr:carbon-nitrogen hydrolase family protein [Leucobacter sp. wl10]RGE19133.1 carbon-nitrogen hydrolase family protein [Leucobacter sp. wl10]